MNSSIMITLLICICTVSMATPFNWFDERHNDNDNDDDNEEISPIFGVAGDSSTQSDESTSRSNKMTDVLADLLYKKLTSARKKKEVKRGNEFVKNLMDRLKFVINHPKQGY